MTTPNPPEQRRTCIGGLPDGWITFEGVSELVLDIPWEGDFLLPMEVVDAIRSFTGTYPDGLIRCDRVGPEVAVAGVREIDTHYAGVVCPACMAEHEDWDNAQWLWFLASREQQGGEAR